MIKKIKIIIKKLPLTYMLLNISRRLRIVEFLVFGLFIRIFSIIGISGSIDYAKKAVHKEDNLKNNHLEVKINHECITIIEPWPYGKKLALTINFDDISPNKEKGLTDFGGDLNGIIVKRFEELLSILREIKVTLFIPALLSIDLAKGRFYKQIGSIDDRKYERWRNWLKHWESTGRVEVALHGLYHYNYVKKSQAEFEGLSYEKAKPLMVRSLEIMQSAGFFPLGFRPPAWALGFSNCLINIAKELGFAYIAASGVNIGLNSYEKLVSDLLPTYYQGIINIPQNIVLGLRNNITFKLINEIEARRGVISIKGHFADSYYLASSLNITNYKWLISILYELYKEKDKIWFASMSEIAKYKICLKSIRIQQESSNILIVKNEGKYTIDGLTIKIANNDLTNRPYNQKNEERFVLPSISTGEIYRVELDSKKTKI